MNLKTTIVLLALILLGALGWLAVWLLNPGPSTSETLTVLQKEFRPENLTRIEVVRGDRRVVLEKGADGWSLPGKWPVRKPEVEQLIGLLTSLHTRFAPIPAPGEADLKKLGLTGADALQVHLKANGKDYKLTLAEEPSPSGRFSQPTYLRLGEATEVLRVAPGLIAALDRPQEYYMQRRLFPVERVAKEGGSRGETVERLTAKSIAVRSKSTAESKEAAYTLVREGSTWELRAPVRDRVDPDRVKTILNALPDIWVERFKEMGKKSLEEFGLKDPAQVLKITRPQGDTITLLVGKTSDKRTRFVQKPPHPQFPGKPGIEVIEEEFKFAKLQDNDQLFEIKADRLKDLVVSADTLRDAQLARFKTEDVKKLAITDGGRSLVFLKTEDGWKLEKPAYEAERAKVDELLDKFAGLKASEKDILDKADPKTHGLEKPARVTVTVAESKDKDKDKDKDKKTREISFLLGKVKDKLYVQVAGWDRVNVIEGDVLKLVERPPLAYRNRKVLNLSNSELARIDVQRPGETYALEQHKDIWRLAAPVQAELEPFKGDSLPREVSHLEAVEFITADPKAEDLDKVYGLTKPAVTLKLIFNDKKKAEQTVQVGKLREGKEEYYARLGSDPTVFTIKKDIFETLAKDSLSLRPTEPWKLDAEDIGEVRVRKGSEYLLKREGAAWKLDSPEEPITATVAAPQVEPLAQELAHLKVEKYVAHTAKDLVQYGLDTPYLRVAFKPGVKIEKEKGKDKGVKEKSDKEDRKERVLLIGKLTAKDAKTRFARLGDSEAIFVLGEKAIAALDRGPLDLLDRQLLFLDPQTIQSTELTEGKELITLRREKDSWRVEGGGVPPFVPDPEVVDSTLMVWWPLRAKKLVAYGDKVALAKFGLEKPVATVTVIAEEKGEKGKPAKKVTRKLLLGAEVADTKGDRYARLEGNPAVVVLDADAVADLKRYPLEFVNHTLLKVDPAKVLAIERHHGKKVLELTRKKDGWHLVKPTEHQADESTLSLLVGRLARLRAKKVAAYPVTDFKPFGFDTVVTVRVEGEKDKTTDYKLEIGKLVDEKGSQDRFARLEKSNIVVVLSGTVAQQLLASPLEFRDRLLVKLPMVDKLVLKRETREATFTQVDGDWKMTQPVVADVEQGALQDFLKSFAELRVHRLVALKPADLKPYGLDRPQAQWQLFQGDKEVATLLVGGQEKDSKRVYAKLAKSDLVVLLDEKVSSQVLGELRNRKIWPVLDAVQVEELKFANDKGNFTLTKKGKDWSVVGKPEAKVKTEVVRDTLDTLARLQAERWMTDNKGDAKLFGLDPPTLTLSLQTTTGKRTLKVGRQEGGSGAYYAVVDGENGGAVFLISRADAPNILRTLEAFLGGKASH